MSDQTNAPTPSTTATAALITELSDDREVVVKAISAFKKEGWKGLIPLLPEITKEVREDVESAIPAVAEIKAGYLTTEFWLAVGLMVLNAVFVMVTGKSLPMDTNVVLGAVVMIYTAVRGFTKSKSK